MKLLILSITVALAAAGRLENTYLPPHSAGSASGGAFLAAPHQTYQHVAVHQTQQPHIPILKLSNENPGDGNYRYSFETANRIVQQEVGHVTGADSSAVQGSYSYAGADGQTYTVNYVADENGFRANGAHLPVAPPVPEAILKSLQLNAAEEAAGIVDDGQYRASQHGGASGQYVAHAHSGGFSGIKVAVHHQQQPASQYLPPQQQGGYRY